jgi:hypothetical protein
VSAILTTCRIEAESSTINMVLPMATSPGPG